jgi:hypothetical protein
VADDAGGLSIPDTDNWSEWTFEQALKALTGEGVDLHAPAKATWFNFNPSPSEKDYITYHAWGDYFYGVNLNQDAVNAWSTAVSTIDEMMPDVARGKRGSMDHQTLLDLEGAIRDFAGWSQAVSGGMNSWSSRLDSDDDSFRGKAAFLIYWRLKVNGDGLTDTYEQLTSRYTRPMADVIGDAATELANFNSTMSGHWTTAITLNMRDWINNSIVTAINDVAGYIDDSGLQLGTPNYKLNAFGKDVDSGKAFIRTVLSSYPKGDLTSAAGWQKIGDEIGTTTVGLLKSLLDTPAQTAIGALAPKYVLATSSLLEITDPPPETPPRVDPGGNGPPDGGGSGDIPPPPGGGGSGDIPPPPDGSGGGGGGGDIPPPDGSGGGDIPPPDGAGGGGGSDIPPPGGSGSGDIPPPDGGAGGGDGLGLDGPPADGGAGGGGGGFVPGFVPPGGGVGGGGDGAGGGSSVGPGGDGSFNEPGGGNGVITPPDGGGSGGSELPPGAGNSRTTLPPGADGGGSGAGGGASGGFGSDPGKGFGSGAGVGAGAGGGSGAGGGVGGGPGGLGDGFGGAGGGLGGAGGGLGGAGGGLGGGLGGGVGGVGLGGGSGSGGLTGLPTQLSGGSPGAGGAPGSSGGGEGGVPFFPPMMGGQGAGGDKPQERERQTWLSEDEEIWGTRVDVGSGVIGRLDEEEFDVEEVPLTGPTRRQRRADTPRRPRPAEQAEQAEREGTAAGEEASGTA